MKKYKRFFNTPEYRKRYTGIYGSWYAMKQRCNNPKYKQYKDYGGRGITFDPRWKAFDAFNEDMRDEYKTGLTLDRIDNNGNYCKENCRWATRKEQCRNKRRTLTVEHEGKQISLAEYAELVGGRFGTMRSRYYRGMSPECVKSPLLFRPAKL